MPPNVPGTLSRTQASNGGRPILTRTRLWIVLWLWNLVWALINSGGAGGTWHYFADGVRLLTGGGRMGGLHLYAVRPDLQIGPLAFLAAAPLTIAGRMPGRIAVVVLLSLTGPPLLAALWRLVPPAGRRPVRLLGAGLLFLPVWDVLATYVGHLDDVLALGLTVAAMHARTWERAGRWRPVLVGLLVAAAADAKPWALAFLPLLLMRTDDGGFAFADTAKALGACVALLAAGWLPFVLYDPHTLAVARFTIRTEASSSLRMLGYGGAATPPWDRAAQFVLGCALGTAAVLRWRWPAVILLGTSARILLDPEVFAYYTSGVVLGAVAFDLVWTRTRVPWLTVACVLLLYVPRLPTSWGVPRFSIAGLGWLRVAFVAIAFAGVFVLRPHDERSLEPPDRRSGGGEGGDPGESPRILTAEGSAS